ncbi:hypothetical protein BgiMline_007785 [Biomphalaria glabrata]|uniref:Glutaminyl-peptide cyclotransferase n=2 Tax=Biomphalaria glabrata TaxID=6526 RepID=A0A9W3A0S9_BIOGL|nr:glutaminyl-peptide cyclotransferase-like isoform X1 [Biomphalaria glabrata]KAI8746760.1 glutaminyl-peptide cyclotransferase [Biomphalaria glabrata]KAI8788452.1 glutaminyl-peptide cyclotransferase [Biomphalaria glabrata]
MRKIGLDLNVAIFVLVIIAHFHILYAAKAKRQTATKRPLRWVTKDYALEYLTRDMSEMDYFKSDILKPIVVERVSGTEGNRLVQEHITSILKKLSWTVELDTFEDSTPYGTKQFTNIIATFDPSKPRKVVLACHFDSKYFDNKKFVAATDSAVPCAILLETARQLQCLMEKGSTDKSSVSDLTLQLLFLDGEEAFKDWTATDSIYGARHLASKWERESDNKDPNVKKISSIREFILLDLIGTTDTQFNQQFESTQELYKHLVKIEGHLRSNKYLTGGHKGPIFSSQIGWGGIEDDHVPFMRRGVEVLHLISTPFPSVWHQPQDDWSHLDFNLIDDFSRIFRVFVSNLLHLQPEARSCRKKKNSEL